MYLQAISKLLERGGLGRQSPKSKASSLPLTPPRPSAPPPPSRYTSPPSQVSYTLSLLSSPQREYREDDLPHCVYVPRLTGAKLGQRVPISIPSPKTETAALSSACNRDGGAPLGKKLVSHGATVTSTYHRRSSLYKCAVPTTNASIVQASVTRPYSTKALTQPSSKSRPTLVPNHPQSVTQDIFRGQQLSTSKSKMYTASFAFF
ncbi:hypothetical protein K449DRAFT_383566, partial [Hypoxylon sp. EC38]